MWPDFLSLQFTKGERKINKFAFSSKEHRRDALELLIIVQLRLQCLKANPQRVLAGSYLYKLF